MIAKGVRFNAVKKKAGRYLGTIIFEFTMPCPNCKETMVIKTDPKSCEYLLVSGCIRYNTDYDEKDIGTIQVQQADEGEKINRNAFFKLETQKLDLLVAEERKPALNRLYLERLKFKDDFYLNQTLRRKLKIEKNVNRREEDEAKKIGFNFKLLPHTEIDKVRYYFSS